MLSWSLEFQDAVSTLILPLPIDGQQCGGGQVAIQKLKAGEKNLKAKRDNACKNWDQQRQWRYYHRPSTVRMGKWKVHLMFALLHFLILGN